MSGFSRQFYTIVRVSFCCLLILSLLGCGRKILKPPPDFSNSENRLSDFSKSLRGKSIKLNQGFIGLREAMAEVDAINTLEFSETFPKNLFKHALMACLNQTRISENDASEASQAAIALGVSCDVLPLKHLVESLSLQMNLVLAKRGMQALEKVRQQRSEIQKMIQEIPDRVLEIRKEINIQNGELRRKKAFLQTKRNDYSNDEWETTQNAVKKYQKQLDDLQSLTKTLLLNKKLWLQKLGSEIDVLYKNIATLGEK